MKISFDAEILLFFLLFDYIIVSLWCFSFFFFYVVEFEDNKTVPTSKILGFLSRTFFSFPFNVNCAIKIIFSIKWEIPERVPAPITVIPLSYNSGF